MRIFPHLSLVVATLILGTRFLGVAFDSSAAAEESSTRPILTVIGKIASTNGKPERSFDRAALEAIGLETVETVTPWYTGKVKFQGVAMAKLLGSVGAQGTSVTVTALDDYVSTIPIEDFTKYHVILAMKRNGTDMAVHDKGPLFVIYPYDSKPELQNQTYYSRSAWQVKRIEVK